MEELFIPFAGTRAIAARAVLVLAPHPDDEVFGCGGAIAGHVRRGEPVSVVILTHGEGQTHAGDDSAYMTVRQEESRRAAGVLGYGVPEFWALPDRGVTYGEVLIGRIVAAIGETGADLVYAPSIFEMHPDHRALAMAAVESVRRVGAGVRLAMYEVGVPLVRVNVLVDISAENGAKRQAMACFASQLAVQAYDEHIAALNRYRTYTLGQGVCAAEAFWVLTGAEMSSALLEVFEPEYRRQSRLGLAMLPVDRPLVSVLIRSMDRATLKKALDSVALQTYPNIEVVVVNAAGVPHRSLGALCGRYPLRLIETGEVLQRSRAANMALDHAAGDLLLFLDDDDWFAADHIDKLAALLLASPGVLAVHTAAACANGQGSLCGPVFERPYRAVLQMRGNCLPIHSVLFSRAVLDKGCRFDESLAIYEDWDFWLQVGRFTDIPMAPGVSAFYRWHQSSGVHDVVSHDSDCYRAIYRKWLPRWSEDDVVALMCELQQGELHLNDLEAAREEIARRDQEIIKRDQEIIKRDQEITKRDQEITKRDQEITKRDQEITKRDATIVTDGELVRSRDRVIAGLRQDIEAIYNSRSWRLTRGLRRLGAAVSALMGKC